MGLCCCNAFAWTQTINFSDYNWNCLTNELLLTWSPVAEHKISLMCCNSNFTSELYVPNITLVLFKFIPFKKQRSQFFETFMHLIKRSVLKILSLADFFSVVCVWDNTFSTFPPVIQNHLYCSPLPIHQ